MSWSITLVGTPEGVSKKLDAYGETLTGQSKAEFDEAKPAIQTLLSQTVNANVRFAGNGHASFENGKKTYGTCSVTIEPFYSEWCS